MIVSLAQLLKASLFLFSRLSKLFHFHPVLVSKCSRKENAASLLYKLKYTAFQIPFKTLLPQNQKHQGVLLVQLYHPPSPPVAILAYSVHVILISEFYTAKWTSSSLVYMCYTICVWCMVSKSIPHLSLQMCQAVKCKSSCL
jgi:hypothetical protein